MTDPLTMQLVSLPAASKRIGKPPGYFTQRIREWRSRPIEELRPPEPIARIGGADAYQLTDLLLWDSRRLAYDQEKRERWAQARAAKTTTPKETT